MKLSSNRGGVNRVIALLLAAIAAYKPDLVILDGIRDLVGDINDGEVAQELIERLMTTARRTIPKLKPPTHIGDIL